MFDPTSRYYNIENATVNITDENGAERKIVYKKRRFIPSGENQTTVVEHMVTEGERLDNISARYLGDPAQFWRICDANNVQTPEELEVLGRAIKITLPHT